MLARPRERCLPDREHKAEPRARNWIGRNMFSTFTHGLTALACADSTR
jgi:hypothetical protein